MTTAVVAAAAADGDGGDAGGGAAESSEPSVPAGPGPVVCPDRSVLSLLTAFEAVAVKVVTFVPVFVGYVELHAFVLPD